MSEGKESRVVPLVFYDSSGKRLVLGEARVTGELVECTIKDSLDPALVDLIIGNNPTHQFSLPASTLTREQLADLTSEVQLKDVTSEEHRIMEQNFLNDIFGIKGKE